MRSPCAAVIDSALPPYSAGVPTRADSPDVVQSGYVIYSVSRSSAAAERVVGCTGGLSNKELFVRVSRDAARCC